MLLIDEFRGRNVAAFGGVTVIGGVGILVESLHQRRIKSPFEVLARLRANRFHLSARLLCGFAEQAGSIGRPPEG